MTGTREAAGVAFREVMQGGFALGETDPAAGARAGERANSMLVLRVAVRIPDVSGFREDPDHSAELDGSVTLAALGGDLRGGRGVVKLFTRTEDPRLKLMAYRLAFRRAGETFCLAGAKHVRGSIFRSWHDTTTLPCRLHAGAEDGGPVVGAGILHLTPADFVRQAWTVRSVNARGVVERTRAVSSFWLFFARELIDSYVVGLVGR